MSRILIGSPIKQEPDILKEFLCGLDEADKSGNEAVYCFVDDNVDEKSIKLLDDFSKTHDTVIFKGEDLFDASGFEPDGKNYHHAWKSVNFFKVTEYKNRIIQYCIDEKFDYLFLIDSDIVIDKRTLPQLLSDDVEIVSNVFWNQWQKNGSLTPQCFWIPDIYLQEKGFFEYMTFQEAHKIRMETINQMKIPGLYVVDGLGACTLIKRSALEKGVNFTEIYNLKIWGEDRPFCIRAGVAGIKLYMDTHYPAYHISKNVYLDRVDEFKRDGFKFDMCQVFEEVPPKRKLNFIQKFILRVARRIVRDLTD